MSHWEWDTMLALTTRQASIDPGDVHDVLRNDRRRRVIEYLKQHIDPVPLRTLAERIASRETGSSPPPTNIRQSVYNSLHQTHLPKLDGLGIVQYDRDRKHVRLRERAREIEPYMNVVTSLGISWSTYYRTVGVVGLFAIVGAETGLPPFALGETLVFATVLLFVLAFSTGYQLWSRRWLYACAVLDR
ncbi:DUF7344 domain-containing protein [Halorhabdus rudnickae]|uniref:DUF7344 domain-containing protein n=1 Tax=Halorhabdus rudnickae TaxID=1775544 RepID=UPI001FCE5F4F|nr:hypothetical protein [Halorhabdus rudnickae]